MSGYLWRATVRNVNRALKEINPFEWEGDYRAEARNRLKALLEERMDEELEQYLGRAKYERKQEGDAEDYRNGSYLRHLLTEIGDLILPPTRWEEKWHRMCCVRNSRGWLYSPITGGKSLDILRLNRMIWEGGRERRI